MTTYFTAPDGHDEPTLWVRRYQEHSVALLRRSDLGPMAHHWDELVARVIAGNPDRMIDRDALTQGIEQVNNTDSLAAAIADRTENAAAALRDARKELPPRLELTEEESDAFTAALQWDTPSPSYRPGCDHPNVKTTQFCPDCGAFVMVSQR